MPNDTFISSRYSGEGYQKGTETALKRLLDEKIIETIISDVTNNPEIAIINMGCGTDSLSVPLQKAGKKKGIETTYHGIDYSEKQLKIARANSSNTTTFSRLSMTASKNEFSEEVEAGKYDYALMENSLYATTQGLIAEDALHARQAAFYNAALALKTGGKLIITDPLSEGLAPTRELARMELDAAQKAWGMNSLQAAWHIIQTILDKDIKNARQETRRIATSTTRFTDVNELIGLAVASGHFVLDGTQTPSNNAYVGNNAYAVLVRTDKNAIIDAPMDFIHPRTNDAIFFKGLDTRILNGTPDTWDESVQQYWLKIEHEAFSVYKDEANAREEQKHFLDDFFIEERGEDIFTRKEVRISDIKHIFYKIEGQGAAYFGYIEIDVKSSFSWHGIPIRKGRYIVPRKMFKTPQISSYNMPYWTDFFKIVAETYRREGKVGVLLHAQPKSVKAMVSANFMTPAYHSEKKNWFTQTRKSRILNHAAQIILPIAKRFPKNKRLRPIVQNQDILMSMNNATVAFNPKSYKDLDEGYIVVQFD